YALHSLPPVDTYKLSFITKPLVNVTAALRAQVVSDVFCRVHYQIQQISHGSQQELR
ncbi:hypothetical protein HK100_007923, partial [Physocladia obscura]